jgi:hypothetical protein
MIYFTMPTPLCHDPDAISILATTISFKGGIGNAFIHADIEARCRVRGGAVAGTCLGGRAIDR